MSLVTDLGTNCAASYSITHLTSVAMVPMLITKVMFCVGECTLKV